MIMVKTLNIIVVVLVVLENIKSVKSHMLLSLPVFAAP